MLGLVGPNRFYAVPCGQGSAGHAVIMRFYAVSDGACLARNSGTIKKIGGLESRPQSVCHRSDYRVNVFCCLRVAFI